MPNEHDYERVLRLGFVRDLGEGAAHLLTGGILQGRHLGIGAARLERFIDFVAHHAEPDDVFGLTTQARDGEVISSGGKLETCCQEKWKLFSPMPASLLWGRPPGPQPLAGLPAL